MYRLNAYSLRDSVTKFIGSLVLRATSTSLQLWDEPSAFVAYLQYPRRMVCPDVERSWASVTPESDTHTLEPMNSPYYGPGVCGIYKV